MIEAAAGWRNQHHVAEAHCRGLAEDGMSIVILVLLMNTAVVNMLGMAVAVAAIAAPGLLDIVK